MEYIFLLGGRDAEMLRISEVLRSKNAEFYDKRLGPAAHADDYKDEIAIAKESGKTIVLVEICNLFRPMTKESKEKNKVDIGKNFVSLSHKIEFNKQYESLIHSSTTFGVRVTYDYEKTSLYKVLRMLRVQPTRNDLLIALNDLGSIHAMLQARATLKEVRDIRTLQRKALGSTLVDELEAEEAVFNVEYEGELSIVRVKDIKISTILGCSLITDRLTAASGGVGWVELLILSKSGEAIYFGSGNTAFKINSEFRSTCNLYAQIVGGRGYWGGYPDHKKLLQLISSLVMKKVPDLA